MILDIPKLLFIYLCTYDSSSIKKYIILYNLIVFIKKIILHTKPLDTKLISHLRIFNEQGKIYYAHFVYFSNF